MVAVLEIAATSNSRVLANRQASQPPVEPERINGLFAQEPESAIAPSSLMVGSGVCLPERKESTCRT